MAKRDEKMSQDWERNEGINRIAVGLVRLTLLILPVVGYSQQLSSWERVEKLGPGIRISCILTDQSEVAGTLTFANANGLTVKEAGGRVTQLGRERVQVVFVRRRPHGNKPLWIGLGAGAVAGAAIGAGGGTATSSGGRVAVGGFGAAIFGAAGMGVGYLLRGSPEEVMVYRAAGANAGGSL